MKLYYGGHILKKYLIVFLVCSKFAFASDGQPSLENRKELKYQTTLSILGADYSGFRSNFTLSVGHFINDKNLINFRYTFQNSSGAKDSTSAMTIQKQPGP